MPTYYCLKHKTRLEYEHHHGGLWCNDCNEYVNDPLLMYSKLDPDEVLIYDKINKTEIIEKECNLDEYISLRGLKIPEPW